MTAETILALIIGGGGIGAIVSALLTRKSAKEGTDLQLLDRAYKEIERLDEKIAELEQKLDKKENENRELRELVRELRRGMDRLKDEVNELKRGEK